MSTREYVFRVKKTRSAPPAQPGSIKTIILEQFDHFHHLEQSDPTIKGLNATLDALSKEIATTMSLLQQTTDSTITSQLTHKLQRLTELHGKSEKERDTRLQKELQVLYTTWPGIYEAIVNGASRDTLVSVLSTFEKVQSGQMDEDQAVRSGMDFMTEKYHLPHDFFNRSAVSEFNQNRSKLT